MYPWFMDFLVRTLLWSPSVRQSATHSCGRLWYLSCHPLLILILLPFLSFLFICVALFSVILVFLGHDSYYEVSQPLENKSLLWFSQEIPVHFICGAPLHWHISFLDPVSYKKHLMFICFVCLLLDELPIFSRRILILLSSYMIFSVTT